jgi:hypothetical protein
MSLRVVLTAGFDGALPVVALAELLRRDGIAIAGLLVVSPISWAASGGWSDSAA